MYEYDPNAPDAVCQALARDERVRRRVAELNREAEEIDARGRELKAAKTLKLTSNED